MIFTNTKGKLGVLAILAIAPCYSAQAISTYTTIDFEEQGIVSGTASSTTAGYGIATAQGYNLTPGKWYDYNAATLVSGLLNDMHLANSYTGTTDAGGYYPNNESTVLGAHYDVFMERADGGLFSLSRFDFGGYIDGAGTAMESSFTVWGFYEGGGSIWQDFTPDGAAGFETMILGEGWDGLASVMFEHWGPGSDQGSFALDNIQVTAVPLPSALLMFVPGLLGLGMAAGRGRVSG